MTRLRLAAAFFVAALCTAAFAGAEPDQPGKTEGVMRFRGARQEPPPKWSRSAFSLTPKAGASIAAGGIPFGPRGALEFAWTPPVFERQLKVGIEASWTRPSIDSRTVVGGSNYTVDADEVDAMALVAWHFLPDGWRVAPYAGVGAGLCGLRATTSFDDGAKRTVREARPGAVAFAGAQIHLDFGALELELRGQRSPSRTRVLNGSSIVPLAFSIGYRIPLGR